MKATLTVGISGSGKSTWATEQVFASNKRIHVTNRDDLRWNLSGKTGWRDYKFTKAIEAEVTVHQKDAIQFAAEQGEDIIIADTNLNPRTQKELTEFCESFGYDVIIKDFPITLEEAWKRDQFRGQFSVGREVLYKQWQQWNEYIGRRKYVPDTSKPKAIVFDVDSTLAHRVDRSPFEWSRVSEDVVDDVVANLARQYHLQGYHIIVMSGRDSVCRYDTACWLHDNHIPFDKLFMREQGSMVKDSIVKENLFFDNVAENYNVIAWYDDRPQVIRMLYDIGIPKIISVMNPWVEF